MVLGEVRHTLPLVFPRFEAAHLVYTYMREHELDLLWLRENKPQYYPHYKPPSKQPSVVPNRAGGSICLFVHSATLHHNYVAVFPNQGC